MKYLILSISLLSFSCTRYQPASIKRSEQSYSPSVGRIIEEPVIAHVRNPESIKEFVIKPYVDRNNPNVRMPGGAMHVVTRPATWNTFPTREHGLVVEPHHTAGSYSDFDLASLKSLLNRYKSEINSLKGNDQGDYNYQKIQELERQLFYLNAELLRRKQ